MKKSTNQCSAKGYAGRVANSGCQYVKAPCAPAKKAAGTVRGPRKNSGKGGCD